MGKKAFKNHLSEKEGHLCQLHQNTVCLPEETTLIQSDMS